MQWVSAKALIIKQSLGKYVATILLLSIRHNTGQPVCQQPASSMEGPDSEDTL